MENVCVSIVFLCKTFCEGLNKPPKTCRFLMQFIYPQAGKQMKQGRLPVRSLSHRGHDRRISSKQRPQPDPNLSLPHYVQCYSALPAHPCRESRVFTLTFPFLPGKSLRVRVLWLTSLAHPTARSQSLFTALCTVLFLPADPLGGTRRAIDASKWDLLV